MANYQKNDRVTWLDTRSGSTTLKTGRVLDVPEDKDYLCVCWERIVVVYKKDITKHKGKDDE